MKALVHQYKKNEKMRAHASSNTIQYGSMAAESQQVDASAGEYYMLKLDDVDKDAIKAVDSYVAEATAQFSEQIESDVLRQMQGAGKISYGTMGEENAKTLGPSSVEPHLSKSAIEKFTKKSFFSAFNLTDSTDTLVRYGSMTHKPQR